MQTFLICCDVACPAQTFLNCAPLRGMGYGCDGGVAIDVFEYMERWGLPDETCM